MDLKIISTVFMAIFIAELGDKTQIATMLFAADKDISKWAVFIGAFFGLLAATTMAVLVGSLLSQYINGRVLSIIAGVGFILIGVWTLWRA